MYSVIAGLNRSKDRKWMGVFIMTFLLYYDAGQAALEADFQCSDLDLSRPYWEEMLFRAQDPKFRKRGTERRHMRGENERKALEKLASFKLEPWELLMKMYPEFGGCPPPSYTALYNHMTTTFAGTQFGPYFIWKLYDIFNVCLGMPISLSFAEAIKYMPDEPRKAAEHFFVPDVNTPTSFVQGVREVSEYISQFDHPVVPGRKCGLAEAETILCMMKGFFKTKTHEIGDDIQDKYKQLAAYPELSKLLPDSALGAYTR